VELLFVTEISPEGLISLLCSLTDSSMLHVKWRQQLTNGKQGDSVVLQRQTELESGDACERLMRDMCQGWIHARTERDCDVINYAEQSCATVYRYPSRLMSRPTSISVPQCIIANVLQQISKLPTELFK